MPNIIRKDPFFELIPTIDQLPASLLSILQHWNERAFASAEFFPAVDVLENEHDFMFKAELPGVKPEDLKITFENNVLTLTGERKFEEEEKKENFFRMERRYGKFTRSFTLPAGIDAENVTAFFENGILNITVPKKEEFKPKQITIGVTKPAAVPVKPAAKEKAA